VSDDAGTTLGTSESNQDAPGGANGSDDDGGTGGSADAGSLAAGEDSAWETRAREWQGKHDRLASQVSEMRRELDSQRGSGVGEPDEDGVIEFDPDLFAARLEERWQKRSDLRDAAGTLRDQYRYADQDLFAYAQEFDSVEALEHALRASHERTQELIQSEVAEREAALRAEVTQKYGVRFETPVDGGQAPAGDPSIVQIAQMNLREQVEFEAANPGVIDRVLRQSGIS
jgi:hypothetical protein